MMHAHMPPYTRPSGAYDSKKLYDETSVIAAAQDAKSALSDSDRYAKLRTAAHYLYHAKLLMTEALDGWRVQPDTRGVPAEPVYIASFGPNGSRIATPAEIDGLRDVLSAEELRGFFIGDVEPRHPMHAEAIRDHDERLSGPEDQL